MCLPALPSRKKWISWKRYFGKWKMENGFLGKDILKSWQRVESNSQSLPLWNVKHWLKHVIKNEPCIRNARIFRKAMQSLSGAVSLHLPAEQRPILTSYSTSLSNSSIAWLMERHELFRTHKFKSECFRRVDYLNWEVTVLSSEMFLIVWITSDVCKYQEHFYSPFHDPFKMFKSAAKYKCILSVVNGMRTNFVTKHGMYCHNNLLSLETIFKIVLAVVTLMTAMFCCFSF